MAEDLDYLDAYRIACFAREQPIVPGLICIGRFEQHNLVKQPMDNKLYCTRSGCGYSINEAEWRFTQSCFGFSEGWRRRE